MGAARGAVAVRLGQGDDGRGVPVRRGAYPFHSGGKIRVAVARLAPVTKP